MKGFNFQYDTICSCGEDKNVFIWKNEDGEFKGNKLQKNFAFPVWKVEFNKGCTELAILDGNNTLSIFSENYKGEWIETETKFLINIDSKKEENPENK